MTCAPVDFGLGPQNGLLLLLFSVSQLQINLEAFNVTFSMKMILVDFYTHIHGCFSGTEDVL